VRLTSAQPHPALRHVVSRYVDFEDRPGAPVTMHEAPGRSLVVIVDLDSGWTVEGDRFGSFVGGLYAHPVTVQHGGTSRAVQFDLEPLAARALLGVPAGELGHLTVDLHDLIGPDAARLQERLHDAPTAAARFALLDRELRRRTDRAHHPRPDVARAWQLLHATHGSLRVEQLAEALGCSRRHLAKRFKEEVGVSPKTAARLIRFETARRRLGTVPLAQLAADLGYADQAHLTREFTALGGAPPTQFPHLQDAAAATA
jgi:AraC-like DNA-binding protein